MPSLNHLRQLVLQLPESVESPHFEKISFRVRKKIFATLAPNEELLCLKLNPEDQDVFSVYDRSVIYPVPNKWGLQGWTYVDLSRVRQEVLEDAVITAYCTVAPKTLADRVHRQL